MAETYGLIISPAISRVELAPGKKIQGKLTVTNAFEQGKNVTVDISIKNIFQQNGNPIIIPDGQPFKYSMKEWITVDTNSFFINQGEKKEINYEINVPNDPSAGGKYAVIVFKTEPIKGQGDDNVNVVIEQNLGHVIIGKVPGNVTEDSDIVSFSVNKPVFFWWPGEPITFNLDVKNTGNTDVLPTGDIFVHSGDITKSVKSLVINQNEQIVLPENTRKYETNWKNDKGFLTFSNNGVNINFEYFRFGKFTATAKIGHEENNTRVVTERVVEFWILPWYLILAILLAVIGIISLVGLFYGKNKHKKSKKRR